MTDNIKSLYLDFFKRGGYLLSRLLLKRLELSPSGDDVTYSIDSLFLWQDSDSNTLQDCLEKEFVEIKDIYFLMEALSEVMSFLGRGYGAQLHMRYGLGTKKKEDGIRADVIKERMFPALFKAMDAFNGYDFSQEGVEAVKQALNLVEIAKKTEKSFIGPMKKHGKAPIDDAVDIAKIFKKEDAVNYNSVVSEFASGYDDSFYSPTIHYKVKVEKRKDSYLVYADFTTTEEAKIEMFSYSLYVDDKLTSISEYPTFEVEKEPRPKKFRIEANPKALIGDTLKPEIHSIGDTHKLSIKHYPQICRYQLLKDGKVERTSHIPEFIVTGKYYDLNGYQIRIIRDQKAVDDMLSIKKHFSGIEKESGLERRTSHLYSKNTVKTLFMITKSMEVIKKEFPETYQRMMKYRNTGNEEKKIDTFWMLSALCLTIPQAE